MVPHNPIPIIVSIIGGVPISTGILSITKGELLLGIPQLIVGIVVITSYIIIEVILCRRTK